MAEQFFRWAGLWGVLLSRVHPVRRAAEKRGATMARTFYRIYLYLVLMVLLMFAAITSASFLGNLLQRAVGYSQPYYYYGYYGGGNGQPDLRQPGALAVTALVITAIFGGLHYWLIRRDIAHDFGASRGAVRAFFLNFVEAISAIVVAVAGAVGFTQLGNSNNGSVSSFGTVIAFGVLFALLEVERRRGQPDRGAALVLQRLNYYLIQLILLGIAIGFTVVAITDTVGRLIISTGYAQDPCASYQNPYEGGCYFNVGQFLGGEWLGAAWLVAIWAGYGLMARGDVHSVLRAVFRYLALFSLTGYLLSGVEQGLHTLFQHVFGAPVLNPNYYGSGSDVSYYSAQAQFNFVPTLVVGVVVSLVYWLWLRSDAAHGGVMKPETNHQTSLAVFGAVAAGFFWVGLALTLGGIFERLVPGGNAPSADTWALDLAVVATGLIYVPTALWLSSLARGTGVSVPRRAFVYYQLAFGTLGAVISLIFVLNAFVTNALGEPSLNWQQQARQGVANIIIGAILVGIYVFIARREGWFTRQPTPSTEPAAVPSAETLESVLDELTARRLTRDEAAARIRALSARGL
jgi:hypothetical protein